MQRMALEMAGQGREKIGKKMKVQETKTKIGVSLTGQPGPEESRTREEGRAAGLWLASRGPGRSRRVL